MQSKVSRRQLIAAGAVGAAVAATTSVAQAASKKPQFDKVYDVIVVGSGFAGLAAALESRLGGAEVLLIEKMPAFGGNSAINGGAFSVAGSPLQKKFGIKDSPEQMLADMIRSGRGLSHVDLLKNGRGRFSSGLRIHVASRCQVQGLCAALRWPFRAANASDG